MISKSLNKGHDSSHRSNNDKSNRPRTHLQVIPSKKAMNSMKIATAFIIAIEENSTGIDQVGREVGFPDCEKS